MPSFEELGVSPPLEEALAAEGIEVPTPLQAQAVPLLLRGNSAVLRAGPGSGILVAYGVPLLERLTPAASYPQALVITLGRERAGSLATSLARLAVTSGHRVGALGVPWAVPERSDVLFATQEDLERYVRTAAVKVDEVRAVVLDQAGALLADGSGAHLPILLASIERQDLQLIVVSDPIDSSVRELVERHARRAVFLPPEAGSDAVQAPSVPRGSVRVHAWTGDEDDLLAAVVEALLDEGFAHVMTYARSEDRAADVGDLLVLRGFAGGAPGDRETPVWLGVDALEARAALEASGVDGDRVVSLSLEVPIDADELDRRHGRSPGGGVVLAHPRELPHLRRAAREAGVFAGGLDSRGDPREGPGLDLPRGSDAGDRRGGPPCPISSFSSRCSGPGTRPRSPPRWRSSSVEQSHPRAARRRVRVWMSAGAPRRRVRARPRGSVCS